MTTIANKNIHLQQWRITALPPGTLVTHFETTVGPIMHTPQAEQINTQAYIRSLNKQKCRHCDKKLARILFNFRDICCCQHNGWVTGCDRRTLLITPAVRRRWHYVDKQLWSNVKVAHEAVLIGLYEHIFQHLKLESPQGRMWGGSEWSNRISSANIYVVFYSAPHFWVKSYGSTFLSFRDNMTIGLTIYWPPWSDV